MKEVFLRKMVIDNFKGIGHFEVDIDCLLTQIRGNNGTGKTSVYAKKANVQVFSEKMCFYVKK